MPPAGADAAPGSLLSRPRGILPTAETGRRITSEGLAMRNASQERLYVQNVFLRAKLAKVGVLCEERRACESLENENRWLRERLRWYLDVVRGSRCDA